MDSFLDQAKALGCDGVSLGSCFFPELGETCLTGLRKKLDALALDRVYAWGHPHGLGGGGNARAWCTTSTTTTEWTLRPKVLAIVDEQASAIDARLPVGPVTLAKLHPDMTTLTVVEGELTGYAPYPGSDCLNGGVIRVPNGHRLMSHLASHHYLLMTGHNADAIDHLSAVFGLKPQAL